MGSFSMTLSDFIDGLRLPKDVTILAVDVEDGVVTFTVPGNGEFELVSVPVTRTETVTWDLHESRLIPRKETAA